MEETHIRKNLTSDTVINKQRAGLLTNSARKFQYNNGIFTKLQRGG